MLDFVSPSPSNRAATTPGRISNTFGAQGVAYPNPFFDLAHTYLPASIRQLFQWCRYYYLTQPLIAAVVNKMAEYPITEIILDTANAGLKKLWERFFINIDLRAKLIDIGLYFWTYGNAIISLLHPFMKWLTCSSCGFGVPAKKAKHRFRGFDFVLTCPKCGHQGKAEATDRYLKSSSGTRIILWNPEDLEIEYNPLNQEATYYYAIPQRTLNDITLGKREVVDVVPQVFIDAAKKKKTVTLNRDNIYHLKRSSILSGPRDTGWGTPLSLPVLKDVFYLQLMKKSQEAILLERLVPLNVMFPSTGSGTADPYTTVNLTDWKDHISKEIQRWRLDHNYIPVLPIPIGSQTIGGDGRALLLAQEIKVWSEWIVAGLGVPYEFIFGGLSWSGSSVSLRMVENMCLNYTAGLLKFITDFLIPRTAAHMGWPTVDVHMKPLKMADDLQKKAYLLQLKQLGLISDETLITDADLNPAEERKLIEQETKARLEALKKQQIAEAEIQGEAAVMQARYQARAQTVMAMEQQQAQQGLQNSAPGEAGENIGAPSVSPSQQQDPMMQIIGRMSRLTPDSQRMLLGHMSTSNPDLAKQVAAQMGIGGFQVNPLPEQRPPSRDAAQALI